jgi:Fur family transcriptional regulator, ferric uptake regulator
MAKDKSEIPAILEKHNLRKTSIRSEVLAMFMDKPFALSHANIEDVFGKKYDRVTIYRTLHSFEENGLIHKVPDDTGVLKYAMCLEACTSHSHHDEHIHFFCNRCSRTYCLAIHIPSVSLPSGYEISGLSLTAYGVCVECRGLKEQSIM